MTTKVNPQDVYSTLKSWYEGGARLSDVAAALNTSYLGLTELFERAGLCTHDEHPMVDAPYDKVGFCLLLAVNIALNSELHALRKELMTRGIISPSRENGEKSPP